MRMDELIKGATAEMMSAWAMVRRDFPSDHPVNAERDLKKAYATLSADANANAVISAESLRSMYANIR